MKFSMKKFTNPILLGTAFVLAGAGCSGSGGGSATVPAGAVTIDASNAEPTIILSVTSATILSTIAVEAKPIMTLREALGLVKKIRETNNGPTLSTVAGITDTMTCTGGGSYTDSYSISGDTTTGTSSYSNCVESGVTVDGSISFTDIDNATSQDYSETTSGNLSISSAGITFGFSKLDFAETGNLGTDNYITTKLTVAINFTVSGTSSGGFLLELTNQIVESSSPGDGCPESGSIKITGANNTTAELIYNGDGTATIKANGVVVDSAAFCWA